MAANILDVYLAMVASLETTLQCDVAKGYPSWERPKRTTSDLPLAAQELNSASVSILKRIGGGEGGKAATWQLYLFAKDEVELATLLDRMFSWLGQNQVFDVNSSRVETALQSSERYDSDSTVQQEQHAFVLLIFTQW